MLLMQFDIHHESNIGRPLHFKLENHIKAIEGLIVSDEIEMALKLCDMLPAWHRDNYPKEITDLKKRLYQNLYDCFEYAEDPGLDQGWDKEFLIKQGKSDYFYPRGNLLRQKIRALNDNGLWPWVFEASPSTGALALAMKDEGLKFWYCGKNLNAKLTDKVKEWLSEIWSEPPPPGALTASPNIFVCFETLEHTYRQEDIKQSYYKLGIDFDYVFLSVPYGCLFGGLPDYNRKLGHIRGYTTKDFTDLAQSFFPEFKTWEYYKHHSQVLVGSK